MKDTINTQAMSQFVDAVITARQAIKGYLQPRIKVMHGHDLTYEMFQVLNVLWRKKHDVNQQDIANAIQKGKASITPLIDSLARINLVTRTEDAADRRNKIIALTNEGKLYQQKFDPLMNEFYNLFKGDLPTERIQEITAFLFQISENVTK